ncbi:MAG: DUF3291 domain-containing protein [Pseudomonadota bacterium]
MHIAQLNIGRLAYDLDDPRVEGFLAGREVLDRIVARSSGFVWKHSASFGERRAEVVMGDPRVLVSYSIWETAAALKNFVWNTLHKRFYLRKAEWFKPMTEAHLVLWWVHEGERPSLDEAMGRLNRLREYGPTQEAFDWAYLDRAEASVELEGS